MEKVSLSVRTVDTKDKLTDIVLIRRESHGDFVLPYFASDTEVDLCLVLFLCTPSIDENAKSESERAASDKSRKRTRSRELSGDPEIS